jgi:hypothetical protein
MTTERTLCACRGLFAMIAVIVAIIAGTNRICASPADLDVPRDRFPEQIQSFLDRHCIKCHSGEKPEAHLSLDRLPKDFNDQRARERWRTVARRVKSGEMPPKDSPRPSDEDLEAFTKSITTGIDAAEVALRQTNGRTVLRRLNRIEYENTIRDLLGVHVELKEMLPADSSSGGFDNVGQALHLSSFQMEKYLEAAELALNAAITNQPKPPTQIKKHYLMKDQHQVKTSTESVYRQLDGDRLVMFSSSPWTSILLYEFYPRDGGAYRFRVSASGFQSDGKPVTYRLDAGNLSMTGRPSLVGYFDAPADTSRVIEFVAHLQPTNTLRIHPYGLPSSQVVHKIGADKYDGPGLTIDWVEVEGPLHDVWPPDSHRRIFGDLPQAPAKPVNGSERVHVVSNDPAADARRVLGEFARRAFRHAVADDDLQPIMNLVQARLAANDTFEQAVRVGLTAILVSPEFLFLNEKPGTLDEFALASRLSYFLWSTMPDEQLLRLAEGERGTVPTGDQPRIGSLSDPELLHKQIDRMLDAPQASAFVSNFVGQWLGLREIDFTIPSHILYPEFDEMLKVSMVKEAELFFTELLKGDLCLMNFVSSDFAMVNGRLARHYGIPDVDGWEFRKIPLPADSHRGGVLTMAGVLKVTANGTTTSPVTRGAWVMDRILGTPPPKPPENIAALEPDIRGATTIREQLAKHRQIASCANCHAMIDPPGFVLENFDVIGGWRDFYRTSGLGKEVVIDGKRMPYLNGPAIDPADTLPDGRAFKNIDDFKQLLLANKDQIARALTTRLVTYATGGTTNAADQTEIDAIVAKVRDKNYGFRSLIHEIVASDLFRRK